MIQIEDLSVHAGAFSLDGVNLLVHEGEYAVLMGRSGCGKTTLLECLCGLRPSRRGTIRLHGASVTARRPGERGIGYVPQDTALFPSMTVFEHLAFGLELRRVPEDETRTRVERLAERLQIGTLLRRRPAGLSGGERQRVALGRALSWEPQVLCLDEPLSALDESIKEDLTALLLELKRDRSMTTLHVTHNPAEAGALADRTFVIRDGRVQELTAACP